MPRLLKICCKPSSDLIEVVFYLLCNAFSQIASKLSCIHCYCCCPAFATVWFIEGLLTKFPAISTSLKAVHR